MTGECAQHDSAAITHHPRKLYSPHRSCGGISGMALTVVRGLLARGDTDDTLDEERRTLAEVGAEMVAIPVADRERLLAALPSADGVMGVSFIDGDMIEMMS